MKLAKLIFLLCLTFGIFGGWLGLNAYAYKVGSEGKTDVSVIVKVTRSYKSGLLVYLMQKESEK